MLEANTELKGLTEAVKSKRLFDRYRGGQRATFSKQLTDDRAFKAGRHFEDAVAKALEASNQAAVPINEITPASNQVVGQLTRNSPKFSATARENSDVHVSTSLAALMRYIWYISEGDECVRNDCTDFIDIGMGVMMVYIDWNADWGKGEIKICDLDPAEVYIDPNSRKNDSGDAEHIMVVKIRSEAFIKERYPDFKFDGALKVSESDIEDTIRHAAEDQVMVSFDSETSRYRIIDRYTKIKVPMFRVYDEFSDYEELLTKEEYISFGNEYAAVITKLNQPDKYITRKDLVSDVIDLYNQTGGVYHIITDPNTGESIIQPGAEVGNELEVRGSTTKIEIVIKTQLLEEGILKYRKVPITRVKNVVTIGDKLYYDTVMPIENYPIVTAKLHANRNPFPHGDIRLTRPLQEMVDKIQSLIIAYNENITNVKVLLPIGTDKKQYEEKWGKAGAQFLDFNSDLGGAPIIVQLTQMSDALYREKAELIAQIQRIFGAYAFQEGDVGTSPRTAQGTALIDEMGHRKSASKQRVIEWQLNAIGKVVAELIPHVYTERKVIRLIRDNYKPLEVVLNDPQLQDGKEVIVNDVTSGKYDIQVVSGSMLPTSRMQQFQLLMELYEKGVIKDTTSILKTVDLEDMERILETESKLKELTAMVEQADQYIKKLEGDLQTADREVRNAHQQVDRAKFNEKLGKVENDIEAAKTDAVLKIKNEVTKKKADNQKAPPKTNK